MQAEKKWVLSKKWLVIAAAVGLLLILIGNVRGNISAEQEPLDVRLQAYTASLEEKIEKMLGEIHGVGDVHVLLTLDGSSAFVYATDESNGANKQHVLLEKGEESEPLLIQEVLSDIRGVSVVCKNGEDPEVKRKIIGVLCTGLGIPSNRVFVAGS